MGGRPIVHLEFPANDRDGTGKFYSELFGWAFRHVPDMPYTLFETESIGGGYSDAGSGYDNVEIYQPGNVIVYVASDDIEADLQKAESLGGKTLVPKKEIPHTGWFAVFSDPTGNHVGLFTAQ